MGFFVQDDQPPVTEHNLGSNSNALQTLQLFQGDCLDVMQRLPNSCVNLVLCDLPYGSTQNPWDSIIPLESLWRQYLRIATPDAAFVFTATQPFTSKLVMSQPGLFRYDWVWRKPKATGHLNAKHQPMRDKEDIVVFTRGTPPYYPQMTQGEAYNKCAGIAKDNTYGNYGVKREENFGTRYPRQVLDFPIITRNKLHSSQKPLELMEYMVRTYTVFGGIVMDNCMGSGTTGVAAINTGRGFIGIEMLPECYNTARVRIAQAQALAARQ